jgi:RNA polymerase sigma factor for flagellar operon FliA
MQTDIHIEDNVTAGSKVDPKRKMFYDNLGLVNYVVNKIGVPSSRNSAVLEKTDLVQFGIIGLLDAIERYDSRRSVQFQTYAVSRIKGTIQDELRKLDWVPRSVRKSDREADFLIQRAEQKGNQHMSAGEIAKRLSLSLEDYSAMLQRVKTLSGESVSSSDYDSTLASLHTDESDDPSEIMNHKQQRNALVDAVEHLSERERLVVLLYYYEELTFKEIASVLRISESRVFQIHTSVLKALRHELKDVI